MKVSATVGLASKVLPQPGPDKADEHVLSPHVDTWAAKICPESEKERCYRLGNNIFCSAEMTMDQRIYSLGEEEKKSTYVLRACR